MIERTTKKKSRFPKLTWKVVRDLDIMWEGPYTKSHHSYNIDSCAFQKDRNYLEHLNPEVHIIDSPGFHSYTKKIDAINLSLGLNQFEKVHGISLDLKLSIVPCLIPRGTEYCVEGNHVVSTRIVVFKNLKDLFKYVFVFKKNR